MSRSFLALVVLVSAALLAPAAPAQAGTAVLCTGYSSCESKGYSHAGYSSAQNKSYWNMYTGTNCTNYAAYRLITTNGMANKRPASGVGNARDWGKAMASVTDSVPSVGSIAWWGKTGNHVAYVEKVVSSSEVWVSESNYGSAFSWRRITKSGSGWPDGFIHFSDPQIINEAKPYISGTVKVDSTIKAANGTWSPTDVRYKYQWYSNGAAIAGASVKTFTPTAAQASKPLTVQVTASRTNYPSVKVTTQAVTVAPGTFTRTVAPTLTGVPKVDSRLTASLGSVTPAATNTYTWLANGAVIAGAQTATFTPGPELLGKRISVRVRSTKAGYTAADATTVALAALAPGDIASTASPTISGTSAVGSRLTTTPGSWSKPGLTLSYQWLADGAEISGATGSSFNVTPAERGKTLSVRVTANRPGFVAAAATSRATAAVVPGTFSVRSSPTISGTPRVGLRLTASTGAWSSAGTYTFQWFSGNAPIAGATGATYTPTRRELSQRLKVRVTAQRDGFTSATAQSITTVAVALGRFSVTAAPRITGDVLVGSVVKIDAGTHSPTPATKSYQWLRDGVVIPGATKSSRRVSKNDLGHQLSARVTLRAGGYTSKVVSTAKRAKVKVPGTIKASGSAGAAGKVTLTVKVSASGLRSPDGTVTVRKDGRILMTSKVTRGRATISLRGQKAGRTTYLMTFNGTSSVSAATVSRTLTVK